MVALLQVLVMVSLGFYGLAVVLTRDPAEQVVVLGFFSYSLIVLLVILQAPDVALSAIIVGVVASPLMILLALSRIARERRE